MSAPVEGLTVRVHVSGLARTNVRHGENWFIVSTINRDSSAPLAYGMRYAETVVWECPPGKIERGKLIWQGECAEDSIATHQAVVMRLHKTGNPEIPEVDQ